MSQYLTPSTKQLLQISGGSLRQLLRYKVPRCHSVAADLRAALRLPQRYRLKHSVHYAALAPQHHRVAGNFAALVFTLRAAGTVML